jgi:hypothetical protein
MDDLHPDPTVPAPETSRAATSAWTVSDVATKSTGTTRLRASSARKETSAAKTATSKRKTAGTKPKAATGGKRKTAGAKRKATSSAKRKTAAAKPKTSTAANRKSASSTKRKTTSATRRKTTSGTKRKTTSSAKRKTGSTQRKSTAGARRKGSSTKRRKTGSGGLADLIAEVVARQAAGGKDGSPLAPVLENLAKGLGLSSGSAQSVVALVLGKLLAGRRESADAPSSSSPDDVGLEDLLQHWRSGQGVDQEQLAASGLVEEVSAQTGLDPQTAAKSLMEVFQQLSPDTL